MKSSLLFLLPLLLAGIVTSVIVDPMNSHEQLPAKLEKEKLKGDWILVSNESRGIIAEIFGQVPEPDKIRIASFTDNQLKLRISGESTLVGPYLLDPTKAPRTLDLTIDLREGKKATLQGIYALDGNHLKMCFDSFGEGRPNKFPVKAKDPEKPFGRISVLVLRRLGADPKQDTLDQNKVKCADNLANLDRSDWPAGCLRGHGGSVAAKRGGDQSGSPSVAPPLSRVDSGTDCRNSGRW